MTDFPTINQNPEVDGWGEGAASDPTRRTEFENGTILTRGGRTRVPDMWAFTYRNLPNSDKEAIWDFERNTVNFGAATFNWTHPISDQTYSVKFADKLSYKLEKNMLHEWQVSISLIEAL